MAGLNPVLHTAQEAQFAFESQLVMGGFVSVPPPMLPPLPPVPPVVTVPDGKAGQVKLAHEHWVVAGQANDCAESKRWSTCHQ